MPRRQKDKGATSVLIVEDDVLIARGLTALLTESGYEAHVVTNGPIALAAVGKLRPALLLLDLQLPKLGGLEVCRRLRTNGYTGKILMLTAQQDIVDRIIGLESGADDYITKPFDSRELVARVRAHLRDANRLSRDGRVSGEGSTLKAIMFTDMKNYSKGMNRDESRALARLKAHNALIRRQVQKHDGTVVELTGDAFVATFIGARDAVDCGTQILASLKRRNRGRRADERIEVRIGIHIGDVRQFEGGIKGNAVNVAARLQQLAIPGSILVSHSVVEALTGMPQYRTTPLGRRRIKNIKNKVTLYRVVTG